MVIILGTCYLFLLVTIGFKLWFTLVLLLLAYIVIGYQAHILLYFQHSSCPLIAKYLRQKNDAFILTEVGQYQADQLQYQLSTASHINLWGYWFVFLDKKVPSRFIFKDSLSKQDNARVARTIMRLRFNPKAIKN